MAITEIRILPPLAIGRLGDSETPLEAYELRVSEKDPLGYRQIHPEQTLVVNSTTGEIEHSYVPEVIRFKDDGRIRPVAPFLEVFVRRGDEADLVPLTLDILTEEGLSPADVHWSVHVANIKVERRTGQPADRIKAILEPFNDHAAHPLLGRCDNFHPGKTLPLGSVRYIKPTANFPEIRFRFTPARGEVYGASTTRHTSARQEENDPIINSEDKVLYDASRGTWRGYSETSSYNPAYTNPAQIFAGYDTQDGRRVSWGYLDDECDGFVAVELRTGTGSLRAIGHIGAGPPAFSPDTLPIRTVYDDLEQALLGPTAPDDVPIAEAEEIVRKAFETVRLMNTAVMNGNAVDGRLNVASTMVRQDTNDYGRRYEPIMSPTLVDNLALLALHQRVFTSVRSGAAPWFYQVLRQPEEIGDMSDEGRRKMPALMRGADGRALALTRRQIDTVLKTASRALFDGESESKGDKK
ncbi:hypothetical protein [Cystobacter fuscus]|uniref:hypothetical protein n=1 Tax=Cystobacter fuscus TaxID=43 RepID=UPI002B2F5B20|nr:hypothetical protein F0U63_43755 [Cystobacter fuscus]